MKRLIPFLCISLFSCALLGQVEVAFAPVGGSWRYKQTCPQLPFTNYPYFIVTKDTIIQGKYCTQLEDTDWPCGSSIGEYRVFVHQDSQKIYRYDFDDEEFQLVFDFSKQIGESWKVKACHPQEGDSVTVIVKDIFGPYLFVDVVDKNGFVYYPSDLLISEGFGSTHAQSKLLFNYGILNDCSQHLLCYQDPVEGVIYGDCNPPSAADEPKQDIVFNLFPNPTSDILNVQFLTGQPSKASSFRIVNYAGQVLQEVRLSPAQGNYSFPVREFAPGIYALLLLEDGGVKEVERFLVER